MMQMAGTISTQTLEKFTTFGDLLRFLRRRMGLTQLELSIAVGYSESQITRLEKNQRPPDIATIETRFLEALALEHEPEAVARLLDLAANVRREDAPSFGVCPYKGLSFFDEADADVFVGRETLTTRLVERVLVWGSQTETRASRFLAVVGGSGSGKSSLVRAGLVPALRWERKSADWRIHVLTPTARPLERLAGSLTNSIAETARLMDDLARDRRSLHLFASRETKSERDPHLLLIIDQFEELFALCRSEDERGAFIASLLEAASEPDGPVLVLITLRADFYAHCAEYPQLREALAAQQEYIGAMNDAELRRAIEEPAGRGHWELEPGLVDLLLQDVGHEPGALPLLSHALMETWQRRRGRTMTLSGYEASGGVRGAIAETAEEVYTDRFSPGQQEIARRIFLRLTELGDETSTGDTRRRATFNELVLRPEETEATRAVLTALADARLVMVNEDAAEVAHEALIREWPTLRGWLEDNREGLRLQRGLTEAAQEWDRLDRDPDLLYRGARLAQAREWATAHDADLNTLEREFLEASVELSQREAAEREAQRQRDLQAARALAEEKTLAAGRLRRRAYLLTGAFTLALLLAVLAVFFGNQANHNAAAAQESALSAQKASGEAEQNAAAAQASAQQAEIQRQIATSRELAASSVSNLEVDPELSLLLALQAIKVTAAANQPPLHEAVEALHRAMQTSRLQHTLHPPGGLVTALAFSRDGTRLVTGEAGMLRIWDGATGRQLFTIPNGPAPSCGCGSPNMVSFSPDGKRLTAPLGTVGAGVWDSSTGRLLFSVPTPYLVVAAVFSPDGKLLATGEFNMNESTDGAYVQLWDAGTGQKLSAFYVGIPIAAPDMASSLAFSPDGKRLAVGTVAGILAVWDLPDDPTSEPVRDKAVFDFPFYGSSLSGLVFTPDGKQLITGGNDKFWRVWDAVNGQELRVVPGGFSAITGLAFDPTSGRLAAANEDGTARIWDLANDNEMLGLAGHSRAVLAVAFSPDGSRAATSSQDGTVKIWDVSPAGGGEWLNLAGPTDRVDDVAYSQDGSRLATVGKDGEIAVWDATTGRRLSHIDPRCLPYGSLIWNVSLSPDGSRVAAGRLGPIGNYCDMGAWDVATGKLVHVLNNVYHDDHIVYSPDGQLLGVGPRIVDAATGATLHTLDLPPDEPLINLAFSHDGHFLVTITPDGVPRLWDARTGELLRDLAPKPPLPYQGTAGGYLERVAFSPDGKLIAATAGDATITIWQVETGKPLQILTGPQGPTQGVAFSPDGGYLAVASSDGSIRIWDMRAGLDAAPLILLGHSAAIVGIAFSPDGKRLAAASEDGTTRVYALDLQDLISLAKARVTRTLTTAECQRYLHVDQCPPP
jgi:WD40 repeat protein